MRSQAKATTVIAALTVLASLAAQPAAARTVANTHDGKPNILVVMTDDQALNDIYATTTNGVKAMPNLQSLIAANGVTFNNAVDSFPLCCPSRATFLTGEYSHNHGVGGNFWPYGWYGMSGRNNTLPVWLHSAGYYTAAVGKWLNGYGAGTPADTDAQGNPLKKNGEIPSGFDNWNGAIDVSAYDYFNLALNQNGKTKYWGDSNYSKALNNFARIQVKGPASKSIITVLNWAAQYFGGTKKTIGEMFARAADPTTYGKERSADYSPDVTAGISDSIIKTQTKSKKPFFLWWSPAAPHREDVNGGIRNGNRAGVHFRAKAGNPHVEDTTKIVPDPRPAPRYASLNWDWSKITSKPNYDQAPTDKPSAQQQLLANSVNTPNPVASLPTKAKQLQADYNGRLGGIKAVDDGIKKLVARLKATGQYNNTLIIFTSDNGWLQGEHSVRARGGGRGCACRVSKVRARVLR